jgi:hypothetical protein
MVLWEHSPAPAERLNAAGAPGGLCDSALKGASWVALVLKTGGGAEVLGTEVLGTGWPP